MWTSNFISLPKAQQWQLPTLLLQQSNIVWEGNKKKIQLPPWRTFSALKVPLQYIAQQLLTTRISTNRQSSKTIAGLGSSINNVTPIFHIFPTQCHSICALKITPITGYFFRILYFKNDQFLNKIINKPYNFYYCLKRAH